MTSPTPSPRIEPRATDIAIVGMACRLPGAADVAAFWRLLREQRCARRELSDDELRSAGLAEERLAEPNRVKVAMPLADIERFDAGFFGLSPHDAALFDPQHRIWLELCHTAFEHAGHVPARFAGRIGVFAGCGENGYLRHNLLSNPELLDELGMFVVRHTGNDKDFLATRTSYQFDLRGPSVSVQTACSTSLVAVHQAIQSLLAGECDLALAGGVTVVVPQDRGYRYRPGEVLSPDGFCRAFDAAAAGTVFGSGAGVVVLRRLADALADGDHVHAVLVGSAVNNDGARKVGYLAPSVDGHAECVAEALAMAEVTADHVQYVEAHGTGTPVGDPIEVAALRQAFAATTARTGYCGLGSVKTNLGHLDTAAGIASLLKVVLALQHGEIPATLHFRTPNPRIDFAASPFRVVAAHEAWPRPANGPRLAGVSSLGVGGTNAHVVVREAAEPSHTKEPYPRRLQLLPVSGKVPEAAVGNVRALAQWLRGAATGDLADVAWTMQMGRAGFVHRTFAVGEDGAALARDLDEAAARPLQQARSREPSLVFLFPGGGAQHPGMGAVLYAHERAFRDAVDACLQAMPDEIAAAVRRTTFAAPPPAEAADELLRPQVALPALFTVEYALARTLLAFGVEPAAMIGHSLGEYVAACLCGTFSLGDALRVVGWRADLFAACAPGAMLSVALSAEQALRLGSDVAVAAANAPQLCVLSGTVAAIARVEAGLRADGIECQRLHLSVAAHSHLLDPHLAPFRARLRTLSLQPPVRPWLADVTGDWIEPERAVDPEYWVEHLRRTVQFQRCLAAVVAGGERLFVEVGPNANLGALVRALPSAANCATVATMPHAQDDRPADLVLLRGLGQLWQHGVELDWVAFHGGVPRRRVPLPTYAFQRQRHWIEPGHVVAASPSNAANGAGLPTRRAGEAWLSEPVWSSTPASSAPPATATWWIVGDDALAAAAVQALRAAGQRAVWLRPSAGEGSAPLAGEPDTWQVPCERVDAIVPVLAEAPANGGAVRLLVTPGATRATASATLARLLALAQAAARLEAGDRLRALVVTASAVGVAGEPVVDPTAAVAHGFVRVAAREFPGASWRALDVEVDAAADPAHCLPCLWAELERTEPGGCAALRGDRRWLPGERTLQASPAPVDAPPAHAWRRPGTYLVSGGLGGIGRAVVRHLAEAAGVRLVVVTARPLPPVELRDEWRRLRPFDPRSAALQLLDELRGRGVEIEVVAADVGDVGAMRDLVQRLQPRHEALAGVVHVAGGLDDAPLLATTAERLQSVVHTKLGGAAALDAATAARPPALFVLFGSVSGRIGVPGQAGYAAAHSALAAFATWRRQQRTGRTVLVDWGPWRDGGMLAAAQPVETPPWLGTRTAHGGVVTFARQWSPRADWQLGEHRLRSGEAVLPGTAMLALLVAAARGELRAGQVRLRRLEFPAACACADDGVLRLEVRVTQDGAAGTVELFGDPGDGAGAPCHARAEVARVQADAGRSGWLDLATLRARLPALASIDHGQAAHLVFGLRWQGASSVRGDARQRLAELRLAAAFAGDLDEHDLHPALLDRVFGIAAGLARPSLGPGLLVPIGCDEVVVLGRLPAHVVAHVVQHPADARTRWGSFDVTVAGPHGVVVLVLRNLQLLAVDERFGATRGDAVRPRGEPGPRPSAMGSRAQQLAALGFSVDEGLAVLGRVLDGSVDEVLASPFELAATERWLAGRPVPRRTSSIEGEVPALPRQTPGDDVERLLQAAFSRLLGVSDVGLDRDFFELGGHSLLAVRLFARLQHELGVDLELATLLRAGSVRQLAEVVRRALGRAAPGEGAATPPAGQQAPFRHLVPIQRTGARPPLFLVHGAGGNVLGFRELAAALGREQPLFGLQARGVDGACEPHSSIAAMADAYLDELLQQRPNGPFLLGGYSGGGVVAYEMAQRLRARGALVPFVGMIDSPCPQRPRRSAFARTVAHLQGLVRQGPRYPLGILRTRYERWVAQRDTARARQLGQPMPQQQRGFAVQFAFERAFGQHVVEPYDGPVWLFRAAVQQLGTRFQASHDLGWAPLVARLHVEVCPGDHFSMCVEPNVGVLCARMNAAIDAALRGS